MSFTSYSEFELINHKYFNKIPKTWKIERLYDVVFIKTSNVDKKSIEEHKTVKLCNYIDVYKNDNITNEIEFMVSTASDNEIEKFSLSLMDVIITKDSETPFDIGVPALVTENIENLVCGYHLSILRSFNNILDGKYLFYTLKSLISNYQFSILANGVTRFGLSYDDIKNIRVCFPKEIDEQKQITTFLEYKTVQIDQLIEKKKKLIEKLNEKRIALISKAVTKGLDETAHMKDSGVEWLGEVPAQWNVKKLKFCFNILNNRRIPLSAEERTNMGRNYPYYGASGIIDYVADYIFDESTILVAEDGANLLSRSTPLAFTAVGKYWVNNHAHILSPSEGPFNYWADLLCTVQFDPWITGAAQPKLTKENLGVIPLPFPPVDEQNKISEYIVNECIKIDPMIKSAKDTISKLEEYRMALITSAVTGKIDVRGFKMDKDIQ